MGDFAFGIPKLFTLLNWGLVQEKTREMRQSRWLAQKVLAWAVPSSMRKDASGVAFEGRATLRAKRR